MSVTEVTKATPTALDVKVQQFGKMLAERAQGYTKTMPSHVRTEAFVEAWRQHAVSHPEIMDLEPFSLRGILATCALAGIMPHSAAVPGAHVLAFNAKGSNVKVATLVIDYRALIDLAVRGGGCISADAYLVYANDSFDFRIVDGRERVDHSWKLTEPRGAMIGAWAYAELPGGTRKYAWMTKADIDAVRGRSKAKDFGPWVSDYDRMALKSIIKRVLNLIPRSGERLLPLAQAIAADTETDHGEPGAIDTTARPASRMAALAEAVGGSEASSDEQEPDPNLEATAEVAAGQAVGTDWQGVAPPDTDNPACPACAKRMWDNREPARGGKGKFAKKKPNAPDFKCSDKDCDGAFWPASAA